MVVDRGALAAQHPRRRPDGLRGPGPALEGGLGGERPDRGRGDAAEPDPGRRRRRRPRTSSAKPTATLEMSSNRRLAILWKAVIPASGSGIRTALISSPGCRTDWR